MFKMHRAPVLLLVMLSLLAGCIAFTLDTGRVWPAVITLASLFLFSKLITIVAYFSLKITVAHTMLHFAIAFLVVALVGWVTGKLFWHPSWWKNIIT
jgi:hypothetical protein